jgi:hypothetical protein
MKKSGFIDSVPVQSPCTEDWNEMQGNDQTRFCSHCSKNVNNLSTMTRKEARKLVRASGGNLCVRYVRHPSNGGPIFANHLTQIARRASRLAAGVVSASITMTTLAYAQGGIPSRAEGEKSSLSEHAASDRTSTPSPSGSITGTVTDSAGAVIPGATVSLVDRRGEQLRFVTSSYEGAFEFDSLQPGSYRVEVTANLFQKTVVDNVEVGSGRVALNNVEMSIGEHVVLMGVVASSVEYEGEIATAVFEDDINAVSNLIALGESVNKREEDRTTPLFIAVENGNLEMVRLLLAHGARVNARNKAKQTPIMRLDEDASTELVELLLAYGAKVNVIDENGYTPLMIASSDADASIVSALLTAGSKIDAQNNEGMSALMMAAFRDDVDVVKVLLEAGANVHLKDKKGETAWDQTGDEEIENLLVAYGFNAPQEEPQQEELRLPPPPDSW